MTTPATEKSQEQLRAEYQERCRLRRLEILKPHAMGSISEHIDAAEAYITLTASEGRSHTIDNVSLQLKGTYNQFHVFFVGHGDEARQEHGAAKVPGPWAGCYGKCSVIAAERVARSPMVEVADGDVVVIDGTHFRVRVYRRDYIALDLINADGSLVGHDF